MYTSGLLSATTVDDLRTWAATPAVVREGSVVVSLVGLLPSKGAPDTKGEGWDGRDREELV